MGKPVIRELMEAAGLSFTQASNILYGFIGSNSDKRDWDSVMQNDPAEIKNAAIQETAKMYGGITLTTVKEGSGYVTYAVTGSGTVLLKFNAHGASDQQALDNANKMGAVLGLIPSDEVGNPIVDNAGGDDGDNGSGDAPVSGGIASGLDNNFNPPASSSTFYVDGVAPTASNFTATATSVGATSNEAGKLGIYNASDDLISGLEANFTTGALTQTITVSAQGSATEGTMKVSDSAGNVASATQSVTLGTSGNDAISGTSEDDFIFGFGGDNVIRGGAGADTVAGGAGSDMFVVVGKTGASQYSSANGDFVVNSINLETQGIADESSVNNSTIDEATDGSGSYDVYDGGAGGATLVVYGNTDLTNVSLSNINDVVIMSDVIFTESQIAALNTASASIKGDGGSTLRIADDGSTDVDLSAITLSNIGQLDVDDDVKAVMSQTNVDAISTLSSGFNNSAIQAAGGSLNLSSKIAFGAANILASDGTTDGSLGGLAATNLVSSIIDPINTLIGATDGSESPSINEALVNNGLSAQDQVTVADYELMIDLQGDATHDAVLLGREGVQNFISGGAGSDVLTGASDATNFIFGGQESTTDGTQTNTITGGEQRDFISGGKDIDHITGGSGDDFIHGNSGDDVINGNAGTNFIYPGEGADTITVDTPDNIDLAETTPATDTIKFETPADGLEQGQSYLLNFDSTSTATEDVLQFKESAFISGNSGSKSVIATAASSGSKFDVDTADFAGIVVVSDNAAADWSDVGTVIAQSVTNVAADDAFVFAVDNGAHTALVSWADGNSNGIFDPGEISVDAIITGLTDATTLNAGNFGLY